MNIGNLNISSGPNLAMDRSPQGRPKSLKYDTQNQNVRRESAHLRNQREMFLNNFKWNILTRKGFWGFDMRPWMKVQNGLDIKKFGVMNIIKDVQEIL